jgi:hypothetical protein
MHEALVVNGQAIFCLHLQLENFQLPLVVAARLMPLQCPTCLEHPVAHDAFKDLHAWGGAAHTHAERINPHFFPLHSPLLAPERNV